MGRRYLLILGISLLVPIAPRSSCAQEVGGLPTVGAAPAPAPAEPPPPEPLPIATDGEIPAPEAAGPGRAAKPARDPRVTRVDGAADEPDASPSGRLPAGRQAVAVSVDVKSPANMNLHRPAVVRIVLRNTGTTEAQQVRVRDELPEGLKFISSEPPPDKNDRGVLTWTFGQLPAVSDRVIALTVEPVKTGELEHGASVWFRTGSGSSVRVLRPRLRVEQKASTSAVLKGHAVEFKIAVVNDGDGPATDVKVVARLGGGLRYGTSGRADNEVVTDPIPSLAPGQTFELDPLIAEAVAEGEASCTVNATSPDVVAEGKDAARSVATIKVVEPKLEVAISGPRRRPTDALATYEVAVRNPGTAAAKKVRVAVQLPSGTRPPSRLPEDARYDQSTRRVLWTVDEVEPGPTPHKLDFEVRVGEVGKYDFIAEAAGVGLKAPRSRLTTEVFGMPDVDLDVSERQRVVDVNGKTTFYIRVRNLGSKEATNIVLKGTLSKNLAIDGMLTSPGVPPEIRPYQKGEEFTFGKEKVESAVIPSLAPGAKEVIGLEVKVTGPEPNFATLHVTATHDGLSGRYEGMAGVKVLDPSARPPGPATTSR